MPPAAPGVIIRNNKVALALRALGANLGEKPAQLGCALIFKHALGYRERMVEALVAIEVIEAPQRAALGVRRSIDAPVYARVDHKARAHKARLQRHVNRAARQAPAAQHARSFHHGRKLRMGRRILIAFAQVVGAGDNLAVVNHHGANGHLARALSGSRLLQGLLHKAFVCVALAACGDAACILLKHRTPSRHSL